MLFQLQIRKRVNKGSSKGKDELLGSNISWRNTPKNLTALILTFGTFCTLNSES